MSEKTDERRVRRLARGIRGFGAKHGGVDAVVEYLGQRGARIVLVGKDGAWGDLVAPSYPAAQAAAETAEVTVHDEFGGELAARVRTGPYEWTRMAGIQVGGRANT
ncbi:hypothetical protein [Streptomyces sp. NBC_01198]|uniref:hypothetical protein n=1 Tax=Streptomyces sp. NBC_01198 TaxID=2903769 RepID=UPI002E167217|nr:hypothetical protein OG702_27825 [Streptomyces sp. NBC_01198]